MRKGTGRLKADTECQHARLAPFSVRAAAFTQIEGDILVFKMGDQVPLSFFIERVGQALAMGIPRRDEDRGRHAGFAADRRELGGVLADFQGECRDNPRHAIVCRAVCVDQF